MTPLGWIFLTASMIFVWGLCAWCFYRVLTFDEGSITEPPASLGG
jgi:hypothetical protein